MSGSSPQLVHHDSPEVVPGHAVGVGCDQVTQGLPQEFEVPEFVTQQVEQWGLGGQRDTERVEKGDGDSGVCERERE